MLQLTKKPQADAEGYEALETGLYRLKLTNVEEVAGNKPNAKGEVEPRWKWTFEVTEPGAETHPNGETRTIRAWTSQRTGINSTTGKPARAVQYVEALLGRTVAEEETIDLPDLLGLEVSALLTVSSDGKWNNIDNLVPVRKGKAEKAAPGAQARTRTVPEDAELFGKEDAPAEKEALGYPRRWTAAVNKCAALRAFEGQDNKSIGQELRVQALGEAKKTTAWPSLSVPEQKTLVEYAEQLAAGDDVAF